jgi:PRC-barrel domain
MALAELQPTATIIASIVAAGAAIKFGRIERLMIDKASGTIAYAIMSFGGLFGLGDNHYQIPWSSLRYNRSLDAYESDILDEQLARTFLPETARKN